MLKRFLDSIPFENDLSYFPEEDLRITLKFLRKGWNKPWLWHIIIPAFVAIYYELEWRNALNENY